MEPELVVGKHTGPRRFHQWFKYTVSRYYWPDLNSTHSPDTCILVAEMHVLYGCGCTELSDWSLYQRFKRCSLTLYDTWRVYFTSRPLILVFLGPFFLVSHSFKQIDMHTFMAILASYGCFCICPSTDFDAKWKALCRLGSTLWRALTSKTATPSHSGCEPHSLSSKASVVWWGAWSVSPSCWLHFKT